MMPMAHFHNASCLIVADWAGVGPIDRRQSDKYFCGHAMRGVFIAVKSRYSTLARVNPAKKCC